MTHSSERAEGNLRNAGLGRRRPSGKYNSAFPQQSCPDEPDPVYTVESEQQAAPSSLQLPLSKEHCFEEFLAVYAKAKIQANCQEAFSSNREVRGCLANPANSFMSMTTPTGKVLHPPMTCEHGDFLCPVNDQFVCLFERCVTSPTHASSSRSLLGKGNRNKGQSQNKVPPPPPPPPPPAEKTVYCPRKRTFSRPNMCMSPTIPQETIDGVLNLCRQDAYERTTKCCTVGDATYPESLTESQAQADEDEFVYF